MQRGKTLFFFSFMLVGKGQIAVSLALGLACKVTKVSFEHVHNGG